MQSLLAQTDDDPAGPSGDFLALPAAATPGLLLRDQPVIPGLMVFESSHAASPLRIGQRLGDWMIDGWLGHGGRGGVGSAHRADGAYDGLAAIKLLHTGLDSGHVLARFGQEQRDLARLNHPHIAHLLDAGRTGDGQPYFGMAAVAGLPMDRACSGLGINRQRALFLQQAGAVAHARRQLLVHRDVQPSNVQVAVDGGVKLLDVGIAKAINPLDGIKGQPTVAGDRPFTPHFASPEQVRSAPVGTDTDIYSLGVLLYLTLTGSRP